MLIINAGIGSDYDKDISLADNFALRFKTHVFGTFHLTESLLPLINQDGSIINISSKLSSFAEASKIGSHKLTSTKMASIMSKSYLNMYTKLLANRLSGKNIHVLSVHPGWVRTNLSETNKGCAHEY